MGTGLENVHKIYLEGIAQGDARRAVTEYTGHRYTQHSTGVGDGVEGFLSFFEPFLERNPDRDITIRRSFQDGPWVFCSAYQNLGSGAAEWVTMDMFFTDAEGLILEHWDVIAPYVAKTASGVDMVTGPSGPSGGTQDTEANKSLVREYTKQVRQEGDIGKIDRFVAADLTQHRPEIAAGRDGLRAHLATEAEGQFEMLFHLMGDGDLVLTYAKRHANSADIAAFDLYRVQDGMIAEHWGIEEAIGPHESWGNSGKF
ncbi:MAG: nuclear transport factor 2 family protein [Pseudomonadota bacterium]